MMMQTKHKIHCILCNFEGKKNQYSKTSIDRREGEKKIERKAHLM